MLWPSCWKKASPKCWRKPPRTSKWYTKDSTIISKWSALHFHDFTSYPMNNFSIFLHTFEILLPCSPTYQSASKVSCNVHHALTDLDIYRLQFTNDSQYHLVTAVISAEGERVELGGNLKVRGNVEDWLIALEQRMKKVLRDGLYYAFMVQESV